MSGITIAVNNINQNTSERIKNSNQFDGDKFVNNTPTSVGSLKDSWKMIKGFRASRKNEKIPVNPIPVIKTNLNQFETISEDYKFIWLGHSGFILEIEGIRVLVDAVFAERASMFQFMGPKKFFDNPIELDQLPHLDAIILSHDHYDHLDKSLVKHFKNSDVPFLMPLGVGKHLKKWGIQSERIHEFDWYENITIGNIELTCTPARHFTGRGITDRNKTLWASWTFIGKNRRIFYSGDTGFTKDFSNIGEKYGPFDLSIIQIGAYNKLWEDIHLYPEDAIKAQKMLQAKRMIPVHWGTFNLAFHSWKEPIERLDSSASISNTPLVFPKVGESITNGNIDKTLKWWSDL